MPIIPLKKEPFRWKASVTYVDCANTLVGRTYWLVELYELPDIIEGGPHYGAIENIVVTYVGECPTDLHTAARE